MITYQNYISQNTVNYLSQQFPGDTPRWMGSFDGEVARISRKWRLTLSGHEKTSRFGTILYARSERYGDVAVKIVPWFSPRLKSEILCYRTLPYREMCQLYDVDDILGAMLLKYVPEDARAPVAAKEALFSSLRAQRKPAREEGENGLPRYEEVLKSVLQNAAREARASGDEALRPLFESIRRASEAMGDFDREKRYIIHGDAHEYNILSDGEACYLIDPLGYVAPFSFEYARYLGTAMKETPMAEGAFGALTARILPEGEDEGLALKAFAIDTTLRACNTFIEGNTPEEIRFGADWARRAWEYADALARA